MREDAGRNEQWNYYSCYDILISGLIRKIKLRMIFKKIKRKAAKAGKKIIYPALLLFFAYQRDDTPNWAKRIMMGALAYLILPLDGIPDFLPIIGFTDDIGVIAASLATVAFYINDQVKSQAKAKVNDWFGSFTPEEIKEAEDFIDKKVKSVKDSDVKSNLEINR